MGKYKNKLKKRRNRKARTYHCKYAPFVTTWGGGFLDKRARDDLKLNDVVRVLIYHGDDAETRYVEIRKIHGDYFVGVIDDPYYGQLRFCKCSDCGDVIKGINTHKFKDTDKFLCDKCNDGWNYKWPVEKHRHFFPNGTVISFKKNRIMEIPDWTRNTAKICKKYRNPEGMGRMFTGMF